MSPPTVRKLNVTDLADVRRSLVNLASVMLLVVLITGIAGLFAAWSLTALHLRTEKTLADMTVTLDHARSIQVHFKTQVQEWKNILLRGHVQADRDRYILAFEVQRKLASELLEALPAKVDRLRPPAGAAPGVSPFDLADALDLAGMAEELRALNQSYGRALVAASAGGQWNPVLADSLLRGADRKLGERMDAIPPAFLAAADTTMRLAQAVEAARFDRLSRLIWSAILFALAVVALMIWRILRHPALAR